MDILGKVFPDENSQLFGFSHLKLYDQYVLLDALKKNNIEQIAATWFPKKGFYMNLNQRLPNIQFYTQVYEKSTN